MNETMFAENCFRLTEWVNFIFYDFEIRPFASSWAINRFTESLRFIWKAEQLLLYHEGKMTKGYRNMFKVRLRKPNFDVTCTGTYDIVYSWYPTLLCNMAAKERSRARASLTVKHGRMCHVYSVWLSRDLM